MNAIEILLSDARGIYIPRDFVTDFDLKAWGISGHPDDIAACSDPENEWYWEAWASILDSASFVATNGDVYTLYQDGDLLAVCYERMTEEEKENLGWI